MVFVGSLVLVLLLACQKWSALLASLRSAPASSAKFMFVFVVVLIFVSQMRHLARLVSLASFPSPRSASAFSVEFIIVFVVAFIFASQVRRLASLASLTSLGARFHCGVHVCVCGCVCVRCGSASLALLCSFRAAPAFIVGKKERTR
jgi:hypothetical protein